LSTKKSGFEVRRGDVNALLLLQQVGESFDVERVEGGLKTLQAGQKWGDEDSGKKGGDEGGREGV
jgi:hypothetical protein